MNQTNTAKAEGTLARLSEKEFIALFATIMSLTALSMDSVLPAFRDISVDFQLIDYQQTQWIISSLVLGMVFGELLFGPLSDSIGRKKCIVIGAVIYIIGCVIATFAQSMETLLLGRLIQGFGVAGPKIASRALIRDLYRGREMARMMSFIMMVFILVPMLAPLFGQTIMLLGSWRWIFVAAVLQASIGMTWLIIRQPETIAKDNRKAFNVLRIFRDGMYILKRADVMAFTVLAGFLFSGLMLYLSIAQSIFQDVYEVGESFPLYFAMMAIGMGASSLLNGRIVRKFGTKRLASTALSIMLVAALCMTIVSLSFSGKPPFWAFMLNGMVVFFCQGLIFGNVNAMAMEPLGKMAGLGASIISALSSVVAIIAATTVGQFYHQSVTPLAIGFATFSSAGLIMLYVGGRFRKAYNSANA
ncbi:multidrug effflux MFS transporter [Marinomonas balearica]|uniref:Bcr/CflA family efflux transporter n=1 Tax=Marinomonas balearica TaxID=491947 RepID=A0A4R6M3H2_9GAMM|nr:multidrug effflux MFS transporter [Marinomonas balearica]TDO95827.1 DHA1 family bicyclomycin/chloramphenicol resistance-like MFS transporter [Marinomonas balearica]